MKKKNRTNQKHAHPQSEPHGHTRTRAHSHVIHFCDSSVGMSPESRFVCTHLPTRIRLRIPTSPGAPSNTTYQTHDTQMVAHEPRIISLPAYSGHVNL